MLVDDWVTMGATALAPRSWCAPPAHSARAAGRPRGADHRAARMRTHADEVVVVHEPARFSSVGAWYRDFGQTSEEEVVRLLDAAGPAGGAPR